MVLSAGDLVEHPIFGTFRVLSVEAEEIVAERGEQTIRIPRAALRESPGHPAQVDDPLGSQAIPSDQEQICELADVLGAGAEPVMDAGADVGADAVTDVGADAVTDAKADAVTDAVADTVTDAVTDAGADTVADTVADAGAGGAAGTRAEAGRPWRPAGSRAADQIFAEAMALAAGLAPLHRAGFGMRRDQEAIRQGEDGGALLVAAELSAERSAAEQAEDVRFVLRFALEQVLGELPEVLGLEELVFLVLGTNRAIPPEFLAVCLDALSNGTSAGISDGAALLRRLQAAAAVEAEREAAPHRLDGRLSVGFDTHIGTMKSLHGQTNQDAFLVTGEPDLALLVVADGISLCSVGSGDQASWIGMRTLKQIWGALGSQLRGAGPSRVHGFLEAALRRANEAICEASMQLADGQIEGQSPMGTTVAAAVVVGNRVHLAALGDSRAYLAGAHGIAPLTWDQNLRALQVRMALAGRDVDWQESGHALVGFLGHFDAMLRPALPQMMQRTLTLLPGEQMVLCSDGLTDYAAEGEGEVAGVIRQVLGMGLSEMESARQLVLAANRGGGGDNVTVLVFTVSTEDATSDNTRDNSEQIS